MANSVTARFNDDCKVLVAMSDDTTVSKAVIIDAEGNETDIGGGGGSNFATVKVNYTLPEGLSSIDSVEFNDSYIDLYYDNVNVINYIYGSSGLPFSELGSKSEMKIPIYESCKSNIMNIQYIEEELGTLMIDILNSSIVSGDAEVTETEIYVWGDCVLNLTLMGAD